MKRFKFNYPVFVLIILIAICVLTVIGAVFCVINAINYQKANIIGKVITYSFLFIFNLLILGLSLSLIGFCYYSVEKEAIILRFGIVKVKTELNKIDGFTLFTKSEKLVTYLKDGAYFVVVINKSEYDDFIGAVKSFNPNIYYLNQTEEKEN
ncbi:MAG: hypothetical protein IJR66_04335 [Clostridia bacterium]|nr:hypothetical protein [Clostridia bacterium]